MIVVTAPASSTGSRLPDRLLDAGEPLRAIARDPSRLPAIIRERARNEGLDNAEPRTAGNTTPTTFRQWCEDVLKPAVTAGRERSAEAATARTMPCG